MPFKINPVMGEILISNQEKAFVGWRSGDELHSRQELVGRRSQSDPEQRLGREPGQTVRRDVQRLAPGPAECLFEGKELMDYYTCRT